MYLHSAWFRTGASQEQLRTFADQIGEPAQRDTPEFDGAQLTVRALSFSDDHQTEWESSVSTGIWLVGVAEFQPEYAGDDRLVGLLAPAPALVSGLVRQFEDALGNQQERTRFSMRNLLAPRQDDVVQPLSVRLSGEGTTTLVQSDDENSLRRELAGLPGDVVGLTVQAAEQRVTVLEDGSVVFADSASMSNVLEAMSAIQSALRVPAEAW